jgi:hypothetical protein
VKQTDIKRVLKKNKLKNSTKNFLCSVFRWLVPPWFWIHRWLKDQDFLVSLQSRTITPSLLAYPVWLILSGFKLIKKSWNIVFRDYGMQRYSTWIGEHYGPMGRGYFNYGRLSDQEKLDLYGEPRGRIEYFFNNYSRTLKYEDGQQQFPTLQLQHILLLGMKYLQLVSLSFFMTLLGLQEL